jgi:hypothetical protein
MALTQMIHQHCWARAYLISGVAMFSFCFSAVMPRALNVALRTRTLQDADTAGAAPELVRGTVPEYNITVRNTGTSTLSSVLVVDAALGEVTGFNIGSLAPGAEVSVLANGTWTEGETTNTASVSGASVSGESVSDTDVAIYVGTTPGIDVEKYIKDGNGVWQVRGQHAGCD